MFEKERKSRRAKQTNFIRKKRNLNPPTNKQIKKRSRQIKEQSSAQKMLTLN